MIIFESDVAKKLLGEYGCTNIDDYTLINNSGVTFEYNGKRYDARHWRNVYGVSCNHWDIMLTAGGKVEDAKVLEMEKALNEKCLKPEYI